MAHLQYLSKTKQNVKADYADMNAGTVMVFVNDVSGKPVSSPAFALSGTGTIDVPIWPTLPTGQYYLLARAGGQNVARTVPFYVNNN
jgi:hypothetical protein